MRPDGLPIALAVALVALLVAAPVVAMPLVPVADTANSSDAAEADSPGAALSGAVTGEQATLDGEVQTRSIEHRLRTADSDAERDRILANVSEQLERRTVALAARERTLENASGPLGGQTMGVLARASVERVVLHNIANASIRLADSDVPASVRERLQNVRNVTRPVDPAGGGVPASPVDPEQPEFDLEIPDDPVTAPDRNVTDEPSDENDSEIDPSLNRSTVREVETVTGLSIESQADLEAVSFGSETLLLLSAEARADLDAAGYVNLDTVDVGGSDGDSTDSDTETDDGSTDSDGNLTDTDDDLIDTDGNLTDTDLDP